MRYLKILLVLLISVYAVFLLRNIILHATYKHASIEDEIVFKKVEDDQNLKRWKFEIETHYNSYDELHVTEYIFETDSTGVVNYRRFKKKITGVEEAHLYSWASLLPYKKDEPLEAESSKIEIGTSTILHLNPIPPFSNDSVIAKYEIRNKDLVITSYIDRKDPFEYESDIPLFQSQEVPFSRLIPVFSDLIFRIKQGSTEPIPR